MNGHFAAGYGGPNERQLAAIDRIARQIALELDVGALGRAVALAVEEALDAEGASVLVRERDGLRFVGATGPAARGQDGTLAGDSLTRGVFEAGEAVLVEDAARDPRFQQEKAAETGFVIRTVVAAPLIVRGNTIGVVEAVNRRGGRAFGKDDLRFLVGLSPHVSAAIANALTAEDLRRSRDELARHNQELEKKIDERTRLIGTAKREWEQTFDAIEEPLSLVDGYRVRRANKAWANAAQLAIRDVPGRTCHRALFSREEPCPGCPLLQKTGSARRSEIHIDRAWFVVTAFSLSLEENKPGTWVVGYRDVTEEKRIAVRLREAERQGAVARLAAGAAHEINNPMAFVAAGLGTLREHLDELAGWAGLALRIAHRSGQGLEPALVRELGELASRVDADEAAQLHDDGQAVISDAEEGVRRVTTIVRALKVLGPEEVGGAERVELSSLVDRAADRARRAASGKEPPRWLHRDRVWVEGRGTQLDQAIFEVIRNAYQAGAVSVSCRASNGELELEVRDDGPGVPHELREQVFEPFFTTRGVGGGVGLGLTVASGVLRRHGGSIEVLDGDGAGTLVRIRLPLARVEGELAPAGGMT